MSPKDTSVQARQRDGNEARLAAERQLRAMQNRDVEGLVEAVMAQLPPSADAIVRGLRIREAYQVSLEAQLRGDPTLFALPDTPHRWLDLPELSRADLYRLTKDQVEALVFAATIEDHITGFADAYSELFPVEGQSDPLVAWLNRTIRQFVAKWVDQEEGHACRFRMSLMLDESVDSAQVLPEMVVEAMKPYTRPAYRPAALFAYAAAQESATGHFYLMLREQVANPVHQANLVFMARQETQHGLAFRQFLAPVLERGDTKEFAAIMESLENFQMPLADTLENYRRRAIRLSRTAGGYDYREGFERLLSLVKRVASARTTLRNHPIHELLDCVAALCPRK